LRLAILFLAVLLQFLAAVLALRLIRITGHLKAWIFLSGALILMALRRVVSFVQAEWGMAARGESLNEWLGLAVSAAMLVGIWLIKDHFESIKDREQRLAESEATARTLLENAADAVEILDAEGRYLEVNRAACEKLGYRREELVGRTPAVLDSRMGEEAIRRTIADVFAHGGKVFETVHRTRDGTEFPVEVHTTQVIYHGQPAAMSIVRDITERKRHEEILRNARKAEGLILMAGGVAHDFNNLFQVVLANLELARNLSDPATRVAAHIDRARSALDKAGALAQRIQQFSGGVFRSLESTDLNRIAALLRQEAEVWGSGDWDLAADLPSMPLDPAQVRLAMEAVLSNAWEAGGPVRVRTYRRSLAGADLRVGAWVGEPGEGEYATFEVEDHGPGIAPEDMMRLYDPFFSTKGLGRGLGLPAALGIVRGHGGAIQTVSAQGLGTAVRLNFPLAGTTPEAGPTAPAAP
jgi:PAS domain S-box-containing protein